jgi:hypothetical protein
MTKTLELKLKEKFPKLLVDMYGDPTQTPMSYGISCDDGWYDLLYNLCEELQSWSDSNEKQIKAVQIKEKFGGLRYYIKVEPVEPKLTDEQWKELHKMIDKYETLSLTTCEVTGGHGSMCKRGFLLKTLCSQSAVLLGFNKMEKK